MFGSCSEYLKRCRWSDINLQKALFYLGLPAHDVQFAAEIEYLILMSKMRRCILSSFKNHEKEE